jgi:uncharacterized protein (DUF1330 family)
MTRALRLATTVTLLALLAAGAAVAVAQTTQKKAYVLVQVEVTNPTQYANYAKLAPAIVAKYGGTYLARAGRTATLEGPAAKDRVVVLEFPSFERAREFYNSPEYQGARKLRQGAANAQWIVVEAQ